MFKKFLWLIILISLLGALFVSLQRINLEKRYKNFQLVLDYDEFLNFVRQEGLPEEETLEKFKLSGIGTIAFNEDTLEKLKYQGKIFYYSGEELLKNYYLGNTPLFFNSLIYSTRLDPAKIYIFSPYSFYFNLKESLTLIFGARRVKEYVRLNNFGILEVSGRIEDFSNLGIGFLEEEIKKISNLGFNIVLRPENKDYISSKSLRNYLNKIINLSDFINSNNQQVSLIFGGIKNEVLGYPDNLEITLEYLKKFPGFFGIIEAYQIKQIQKGIDFLAKGLVNKSIRVQSLNEAYLAKLDPQDAQEIFKLGVKERNIRLIYLRMFKNSFQGEDLLNTNLNYIANLNNDLKNLSFKKDTLIALDDFSPPLWAILLISLGIGAGLNLLLMEFFNLALIRIIIILLVFPFLILLFLFLGKLFFISKLSALIGGLSFPCLAFIANKDFFKFPKEEKKEFFHRLKLASLALINISCISILGGILGAGLLSYPAFFLQINQFQGVKLLMLLPPIFILIYYIANIENKKINEILRENINLGSLLLLFVLIVIGIIYILRTGNLEAPALFWERKIRIFLDHLLIVRPRFKEVFLAYPALMTAVIFISFKIKHLTWMLVLAAALGQVDLIDTLMHLHTPLLISILRIANGLIFGWVIGLIWIGFIWKFAVKSRFFGLMR